MNSEHRDGDRPSRRTVQHRVRSDEWMGKDVKEKKIHGKIRTEGHRKVSVLPL